MDNWQEALQALGCHADEEQINKLKQYLELLQRWNKVYNLTAVRNPYDMLPLHIYDSLSVLPHIKANNMLDVGSGAGLPGIPLAILMPECQFTLLDSNIKKTRFIQQAAIHLSLKNVTVIQSRIEALPEVSENCSFDAIISRAFSSILDFVDLTGSYLAEKGTLYAMKGKIPHDELQKLPKGWQVLASHRLQVPDVDGERHLIEMRKNRAEQLEAEVRHG